MSVNAGCVDICGYGRRFGVQEGDEGKGPSYLPELEVVRHQQRKPTTTKRQYWQELSILHDFQSRKSTVRVMLFVKV
jgi:hypothetical protein